MLFPAHLIDQPLATIAASMVCAGGSAAEFGTHARGPRISNRPEGDDRNGSLVTRRMR